MNLRTEGISLHMLRVGGDETSTACEVLGLHHVEKRKVFKKKW